MHYLILSVCPSLENSNELHPLVKGIGWSFHSDDLVHCLVLETEDLDLFLFVR